MSHLKNDHATSSGFTWRTLLLFEGYGQMDPIARLIVGFFHVCTVHLPIALCGGIILHTVFSRITGN